RGGHVTGVQTCALPIFRWLGELGPDNGGIARVFLDGAFMKEVDTYAPSPNPTHHSIFQAEHFKATGLADTSHTLTIEVTGRQDRSEERRVGKESESKNE